MTCHVDRRNNAPGSATDAFRVAGPNRAALSALADLLAHRLDQLVDVELMTREISGEIVTFG